MKKFYEVTSSFYDDGRISVAITNVVEAETCPENSYADTKRCDVYVDYFASRKEAEQWVRDVREM